VKRRYIYASIVIIAIMAITGIYAFSQPSELSYFPEKISDFTLEKKLKGETAVNEIQRIHQGEFSIFDGYVLTYRKGTERAYVWIGEVDSPSSAEILLNEMSSKVTSTGMFTDKTVREYPWNDMVITVYTVKGMGLHYYYQLDRYIIWITVPEESLFMSFFKEVNTFLENE